MACTYLGRDNNGIFCRGGNYPGGDVNIHQSHYNQYCYCNNQNNCKGCNYFPTMSWHECPNCRSGVYDNERYCPTCGTQQY